MTEPVDWHEDGQPFSARFGDVYHSASGALAQARHVFLGGCGLPQAWQQAAEWRILETGFGLGLNFLTAWHAWRADPQRPRILHFVSVEAFPVAPADLRRAAAAQGPALDALGTQLAAQWHGLLPGVHRLAFEDGRVLLTLCVGAVQPMLRALARFEADSLFLDGFAPRANPDMWAPEVLRALTRFARRGTRLATWTVARGVRDALQALGYRLHKAQGLPPKRDCLQGVYEPAWALRARPANPEQAQASGRCVVVGAGLAGAAVAASLAQRGWAVTVLEAGATPAAGASGLPAGVLAPHVSPDDALLSRLTRAGARATWQQLHARLSDGEGLDWARTGVLERQGTDTPQRCPPGWGADGPNESWPATPADWVAAGLPPQTRGLLHRQAGWVRPAPLVAAWLAQPGVRLRTQARVAALQRTAAGWQALGDDGQVLAEGARLVLAAGAATRQLLNTLPLQPVRGQLAWGRWPADADGAAVPARPLNGDGHLIPAIPDAAGAFWLSGSTYAPGDDGGDLREADASANRDRLQRLHPGLAARLHTQPAPGWAGVRCASSDRRPLVGPVAPWPGAPVDADLWVSTAMGSRGLSFAALCAELLAARWHGEPLPLAGRLAQALDTRRLAARPLEERTD